MHHVAVRNKFTNEMRVFDCMRDAIKHYSLNIQYLDYMRRYFKPRRFINERNVIGKMTTTHYGHLEFTAVTIDILPV